MKTTNDEAKQAMEAARATAKANPTPENLEAAKRAWAAYDASAPAQKRSGYASRAGQRQARERRANDRARG